MTPNLSQKETRPAPEGGEDRPTLVGRPPVVVVMGHVDHGKTTLLDYIRKANVAAKEAGGITQSIGAYEIVHTQIDADRNADQRGYDVSVNPRSSQRESAARRITFIDTPGHEAFSKMRERGAHVADLAIVVVAADDGVKPQTKEVLQLLKESNTPFVVAINKIDKNNADLERVKQDLASQNVLLEGFGGSVSWQAISAKTGEGVDELLDLVLLASDVQELTYDPRVGAEGVVIEAKLDRQRGNEVSVIVLNGTLREGDEIMAGTAAGKVKILDNFLGERAKELAPSSPALIFGFKTLPQVGETFMAGKVELVEMKLEEKKKGIMPRPAGPASTRLGEAGEKPTLPLILRADYVGTLEALSELIRNLPEHDIVPVIVAEGVGDVGDGDVQFAIATGATIIGFRVKTGKGAERLAEAHGIRTVTSNIIYELIKTIEEALVKGKAAVVGGELEVLALFSQKGNKQVVGGKVVQGAIKNRVQVEIMRKESVLGRGKIMNLQAQRQDVSEVEEGKECGLMIESGVVIQVGDRLVA
ncbi:MAG: GTP-binding protein [bacterium]|nr:GTP-binding protein [bacterium]